MQDRYAGDIGDFGKFALLRALAPEHRLGVCWYRTDGASEANNDGRHLTYVERPERFGHLDRDLFETLRSFVAEVRAGRCLRAIASLEALALLPANAVFHGEVCPRAHPLRMRWAESMVDAVEGADLVFLDPDNGLEGANLSPKSVAEAELQALRKPGRSLLLYHHQARRAGGAAGEAAHVASRLLEAVFTRVDIVRLRPYSSRFYFLIDGNDVVRRRLEEFSIRWGKEVQRYPSIG